MTKQIYAINTQDTKKSERTGNQFAVLYFLFFVTSFIFTPLLVATQTKSIVKEDTKQNNNNKNKSHKKKRRKKANPGKKNTYKKNKRKHNPNLLKSIQKRSSISVGYAEIKTKRMLTKARVAKKDQEVVSISIMKKARTHMQKNRVDRNEFNNIVKQEIRTYRKSKKNPNL